MNDRAMPETEQINPEVIEKPLESMSLQLSLRGAIERRYDKYGWKIPAPEEESLELIAHSTIVSGVYSSKIHSPVFLSNDTNRKDSPPNPSQYENIIFPPSEYALLPRSPIALVKDARNKSQRSRQNSDKKDLDNIVGIKSGIHVLENYMPKLDRLENHMILPEINALRSLQKVLKGNPNLRRYKRTNFALIMTAAQLSFEKTLRVAGTTHGWTEEQMFLAKDALDYQLHGGVPGIEQGSHDFKQRLNAWTGYTRLVGNYAVRRLQATRLARENLTSELEAQKSNGAS